MYSTENQQKSLICCVPSSIYSSIYAALLLLMSPGEHYYFVLLMLGIIICQQFPYASIGIDDLDKGFLWFTPASNQVFLPKNKASISPSHHLQRRLFLCRFLQVLEFPLRQGYLCPGAEECLEYIHSTVPKPLDRAYAAGIAAVRKELPISSQRGKNLEGLSHGLEAAAADIGVRTDRDRAYKMQRRYH